MLCFISFRGTRKRPIVLDDEEDDMGTEVPSKEPKLEPGLTDTESSHTENCPTESGVDSSTTGNTTQEDESDSENESTHDKSLGKIKITRPSKKTKNIDTPISSSSTLSNNTSLLNIESSEKRIEKLFRIPPEKLKGIDPDIVASLKQQSIASLGILLAKRSQALRNLKNKVFKFMKTIITEADLESYDCDDIDDDSISMLLDNALEASLDMSDD